MMGQYINTKIDQGKFNEAAIVILHAIFAPWWNEYRRGVYENIAYRKPFPSDASRATYSRYKQKMIFHTARELHLV